MRGKTTSPYWDANEMHDLGEEIQRLHADRHTQATMLAAAHKMLMDAGVGCGSREYSAQWRLIKDREIARLRKIIDDLPHADYCDTILADPGDGKCDCWKSDA